MRIFYAHTRTGHPPSEWEPAHVHLEEVAERAAAFVGRFAPPEWGTVLGRWHDLGKYSEAFQERLLGPDRDEAASESAPGGKRVDHSTAGARHAAERLPGADGRILAYCIAGHHAGLPDDGPDDDERSLTRRLDPARRIEDWSAAPAELREFPALRAPSLRQPTDGNAYWSLSVFCRMLFSCLTDGDYLATEEFMRGEQPTLRAANQPSMAALLRFLDAHLETLASTADASEMNAIRAKVLSQCREAAALRPGFFSLTVPTGGGKTLSSLAFALAHAVHHSFSRVIYAIPFTTIIEQNAAVFRSALASAGESAIVEHHSNLDPEEESVWGRLAAENWDAPLIVTTNVQLFESLFASRTSACRKLHNIARSVIVLDECQTLPVELLKPTLAMLDELRRNYGCTIVFCTATQPAIKQRNGFEIGLHDVREIVDEPIQLAGRLKRVSVELVGKLRDDELVERLAAEPRVLVIVNSRPHAAALFTALCPRVGGESVFHLSTAMCAAHRSDQLNEIRMRLDPKRPPRECRVISTSLVEAGVDLDFPVVYRAIGGLDSIVQAAGRCNREGRLQNGRVLVFETDAPLPPYARPGAGHTREIADLYAHDLLSPKAIEHFFRLQYWSKKDRWDAADVMSCFAEQVIGGRRMPRFQFRQAAERYRLIADGQEPVLVPYGDEGRRLIDELMRMTERPGREFNRRLQRYVVNVFPHQLTKLAQNQVIARLQERLWVLVNASAYTPHLGLNAATVAVDPEKLIV